MNKTPLCQHGSLGDDRVATDGRWFLEEINNTAGDALERVLDCTLRAIKGTCSSPLEALA